MNRIKTISAWSALILLTFCVAFLPRLVSNQNENAVLSRRVYWNYTAHSSKEISSEQVIKLYQNREFDFNFIYSADEPYGNTAAAEGSAQLFEIVFESNEELIEYMKKIMANGVLTCFKSNVLTVVDNRPVAFSLIRVIIETYDGSFEFIYENKTKTLMTFSYYLSTPLNNYKTGAQAFINDLNSALDAYCQNILGLSAGEYGIKSSGIEQNYVDMTFLILRRDDLYGEYEKEKIYN